MQNPDIEETKHADKMIELIKDFDPKLRHLDPSVALAVLCALAAKYMLKAKVSMPRFVEQIVDFKVKYTLLGFPSILKDDDEHPR